MSDRFDWPLAFDAEKFLRQLMGSFLERNGFARHLAGRMREETGTDFFEWIDHLVLPPEVEQMLRSFGLVTDRVETPGGETVMHHPRATLPRVVLSAEEGRVAISLRPEFVAEFVAAHSLAGPIEGGPYSRLRRVLVSEENGARLEAVERNAYRGFVAAPLHSAELKNMVEARGTLAHEAASLCCFGGRI